jgi:hypothetical protein
MSESNELGHQPIGDVLPETFLMPLPEGWKAETVFTLIKLRNQAGETSWAWRSPGITNHEEVFGALIVQTELMKQRLLEEWE